jgi:hypothetical protein
VGLCECNLWDVVFIIVCVGILHEMRWNDVVNRRTDMQMNAADIEESIHVCVTNGTLIR